jgi:hypothetical protein
VDLLVKEELVVVVGGVISEVEASVVAVGNVVDLLVKEELAVVVDGVISVLETSVVVVVGSVVD